MNVPGRADGNWRWRVREDMLTTQAFQWLRDLTESSGRWVNAMHPSGHKWNAGA